VPSLFGIDSLTDRNVEVPNTSANFQEMALAVKVSKQTLQDLEAERLQRARSRHDPDVEAVIFVMLRSHCLLRSSNPGLVVIIFSVSSTGGANLHLGRKHDPELKRPWH